MIPEDICSLARDRVTQGPWRRVDTAPEWDEVQQLASRWPLRGADLWHLAVARRLAGVLPELVLLTFDRRLLEAAVGEGMGTSAPPP